MATTEQMETWLEEAEEAYHKLRTGQQTVTVTYEGRSRTYSQASATGLQAYIRELQVALGIKPGRSPAIVTRF